MTGQRRLRLDTVGDHDTDPAGTSETQVLAENPAQQRVDDPEIQTAIDGVIDSVSPADTSAHARRLVRELLVAGLKLIPDGRDTGELKLMAAAVKELRYAFRVFGRYPDPHKVTIFGSARTPEDHPDYLAAVEFSKLMADAGWMSITGAGDGIMKAGHEGPGREASFGVAIRLPFEQRTNDIIEDDEKLINFRYFFTRKLMFLSQAEAVVCFPGGFGTLDEAFETLTLIQTGKASLVPVVFVEGATAPGHEGREPYWEAFVRFMTEQLHARGWVSPEDSSLFYLAKDAKDAAEHVCRYYRVYHSSRYVGDDLVIRLSRPITDATLAKLNSEFGDLIADGEIVQRGPYEREGEFLDLPRVAFTHTRRNFGDVRRLIDVINLDPGDGSA